MLKTNYKKALLAATVLTAFCVMIITYFVERFLIQARVENEENMEF